MHIFVFLIFYSCNFPSHAKEETMKDTTVSCNFRYLSLKISGIVSYCVSTNRKPESNVDAAS